MGPVSQRSTIRMQQTTKTLPFYLLYSRQPLLFRDPNKVLSVNTPPGDSAEHIQLLQSVCQEAAIASYERSCTEKGKWDDIVVPHTLDKGDRTGGA
jgi:hypothetical protein